MSWKSQSAFKRLGNTFKRLYEKKQVYKEDFEALKTLQETINELTELRVTEQTLFAKVVCANMFFSLLRHGNINASIKEVQNDLDLPLITHLERLTSEINTQTLQNLMKEKGITFELVESLEAKNNNLELIKKHEKEFSNKILEKWEFDDVKKSFEKTINEFISNPSNYTI
jgi:CHASE3 domain sensor protein